MEVKREGDMDVVGGLFALRLVPSPSKSGTWVELYVEDDTYFHHKTTFDKLWLPDLIRVATQAQNRLDKE